jgi:hypothetical protein
MKLSLLLTALLFSASALASTASANHGHHGMGSLGSTASSASRGSAAAAAGQSGNGGRSSSAPVYAEDAYQPWPQAEMQQFAKPKFVPYSGE